MKATIVETNRRWQARPGRAAIVRAVALLLPISSSVGFVYAASLLVHPPTSSLWRYIAWWLALTVTATLVLVGVGRLSRRLLPLAALLRLSLVFPDDAPSRFRTALGSGTVKTLEERLSEARDGGRTATPNVAARRLLTLVAALDTHDSLTRGHSERVRAYAQLIGAELGLSQDDLDRLNWAALLHDVGKLELPRDVLVKQGKPTESEWLAIRRHPELGEELVAPLRNWLGAWCDATGYHHEKWDGTGYPRGIAGREIPLPGRIVAVADAYDVITSARSYKQAAAAAAGRREIARCAGTHFDPEIVRAFLAISLGRSRVAVGPLAWLADAAVLVRVPLLSAAGTVSIAAVAVASPGLPSRDPEPRSRHDVVAVTQTAQKAPVGALRRSAREVGPGRAQTTPAPVTTPYSTATPPAPTRPSSGAPAAGEQHPDGSTPTASKAAPSAPASTPPAPQPTTPPAVPPTDPPLVPSVPSLPELPAAPSLPAVPPLPDAPAVPPVPSVPSAPSLPAPPTAPSVPSTSPLPGG